MSARAQAKPTPPQLAEANHFELQNGALRITYTATDLVGKPQLRFQNGKETHSYSGAQIRQEQTALGQLLSVSDVKVDFVSQRFTLVLPKVLVEEGKPEKLRTFVVFENGGPVVRPPQPGPVETYAVKNLRGTANFILT
jgi:hypothetical protein